MEHFFAKWWCFPNGQSDRPRRRRGIIARHQLEQCKQIGCCQLDFVVILGCFKTWQLAASVYTVPVAYIQWSIIEKTLFGTSLIHHSWMIIHQLPALSIRGGSLESLCNSSRSAAMATASCKFVPGSVNSGFGLFGTPYGNSSIWFLRNNLRFFSSIFQPRPLLTSKKIFLVLFWK